MWELNQLVTRSKFSYNLLRIILILTKPKPNAQDKMGFQTQLMLRSLLNIRLIRSAVNDTLLRTYICVVNTIISYVPGCNLSIVYMFRNTGSFWVGLTEDQPKLCIRAVVFHWWQRHWRPNTPEGCIWIGCLSMGHHAELLHCLHLQ